MSKYVSPADMEALSKALEWFQENLPGSKSIGWWPVSVHIWSDEMDEYAGWVRWHGDGFWAVEPRLYDLPGGEDE
jgi:hypothetical protein